MFSLTTDIMEDQIALNKELQRLFALRTQKLEELMEIERQLISASRKVHGIHPAHDAHLGSHIRTLAPSVKSTDEAKQPESHEGSVPKMTATRIEEYGREGGLPRLIGSFLQGSKQGETLSSIVKFCLRSGYKSESDDFTRIVTQALYNMKRKKKIYKDKATRKWILE